MMDTSKQYIEMCRQATEAQKQWDIAEGDYLYDTPRSIIIIATQGIVAAKEMAIPIEFQDTIWLPRQDQLQDMMGERNCTAETAHLITRFSKFTHQVTTAIVMQEPILPDWVRNMSMEQLWLAFVMEKKYNKWWDGKDWRDIEEVA